MTKSAYVELHCHSHYSLLDGATSPAGLVERAAALGMSALALTDHDNIYGAVDFARSAQAVSLRPLFGAELTLQRGHHLTLLARNSEGWHNLCQLLSHGQQAAAKGQAALDPRLLERYSAGLFCLTGCRRGPVMSALARNDRQGALRAARWLADRFGAEHTVIELQHHLVRGDGKLVRDGIALAEALALRYVATNNVHYATADDHRLHDVLRSIAQNSSLEAAAAQLQPNAEIHLKSGAEIAPLFDAFPQALTTSRWLAERCEVALPSGPQALPTYATPPGISPLAYLRQRCELALPVRYPSDPEPARRQLDRELALIAALGLANYLLVVWDLVSWAKGQGIRCQGRGSAANSLVAYLLAISPIDPLAHSLVFERFLSPERQEPPDIDIDFATDRREEVIQYLYKKYGSDHVAMAATLVRYRARGALRDAAKALDIPGPLLTPIRTLLDGRGEEALAQSPELAARAATGETWRELQEMAQQLIGIPRHVGLHNGGMILSKAPLAALLPIEPAAMTGRTVVQWDKDSLEAQGWIKIDVLGLRMLSALSEAVQCVERVSGARVELDDLDLADARVYEMISRADTLGVFQVESRAQSNILPRLQPRNFDDLIVAISLVRPGPLVGNMTHPYLRRRAGREAVTYLHPLLEPVLRPTLGVILFQEQVLQALHALSGIPLGVSEQIRRCLGKPHKRAELARLFSQFRQGARARGVSAEVCAEVWEALQAFGGYSFPRAHAAAFALLVYQSAWLKRYHHGAFTVGLLNHQPMGFWPARTLVGDAKRHGVTVMALDVEQSQAHCELISANQLRLGLNYVKGLGEEGAARIITARAHGPFKNLESFCRRSQLPTRLVEHLIQAGGCDGWRITRRRLLWELAALHYDERTLEIPPLDDEVQPPALSAAQEWGWEQGWGLSAKPHLLDQWRGALAEEGYLPSDALGSLPTGTPVHVAGELIIHQAPPTAKKTHFLTLEDEAGLINVIVRPDVYGRDREAIRRSALLTVEGAVQRRDGNVNVVAQRVKALAPLDVAR